MNCVRSGTWARNKWMLFNFEHESRVVPPHNCFVIASAPWKPHYRYLMYSFSCVLSASKFDYQFTFHSNNNHLKNHVCCLHNPSPLLRPSRFLSGPKVEGSNKEQSSSAMSEVNHWRKHFNIFLGDFFIILWRAGAQMMILWTDMEPWKGENVEKGFAFIAPRFNSRKELMLFWGLI